MDISKDHLISAAAKAGLSTTQANALWKELLAENPAQQTSAFSKFLYYFGALIVISAMTWFLTLSWEVFGGLALFFISAAYALFFIAFGTKLWNQKELKIPGGLLITMAVCMTPLAIYGLESHFDVWPQDSPGNYRDFYETIRGSWIWMELGTIVAALVALRFFPFPFLTAPLFFAAWFLTMDIIPLLTGSDGTYEQKRWLTLGFGIILLGIAYLIDLRQKKDYAFWAYFFGTLTFWGALTSLCWDKGEGALFVYLLINLAMMFLALLLKRKVLLVFGGIGTFLYLSHLAYELFKDSVFLPFALSFIGILIIYLGVLYQKNIVWVEGKIEQWIPGWVRNLLPKG